MTTLGSTKLVILIVSVILMNRWSVATNLQHQDGKPSASKTVKISYDLGTSDSRIIEKISLNSTAKDQLAEPSMTRVHQVWTASSSDSLNELSPEVISKLRNDVPFLAAYAMRPRLVGAKVNDIDRQSATSSINTQLQAPSVSDPAGLVDGRSLQTAASSPARQSISPRLGDFSEFNVETSSTSKSEHHHTRKTNLKRKPKTDYNDNLSIGKRKSTNNNRRLGSELQKSRTSKRKRQQRLRNQSRFHQDGLPPRSRRLRQKPGQKKSQMSIIKHGRYYQEQSLSPATPADGGTMSVETKSVGDQMTIMSSTEGESKGGESTAGKTSPKTSKTPFYSSIQPSKKPEEDMTRAINENDVEKDQDSDDDLGEDQDDTPPRRVGDDDVEEDGDTVTVEPKSDGVDDDPEIEPAIEDAENDGSSLGDKSGDFPKDDPREVEENSDEEQDERGRRINRERPNPKRPEGGETDSDDGPLDLPDAGAGTAAGGGLGATLGGASSSEGSRKPVNDDGKPISDDEGNNEDGGDRSTDSGGTNGLGGSRSGGGGREEPRVEFADKEDKDDDEADVARGKGKDNSSGRDDTGDDEPGSRAAGRDNTEGKARHDPVENEGDFGSRRPSPKGRAPSDAAGSKPSTGGSRSGSDDDDDDDDDNLDYQDELDERAKGRESKDGSTKSVEHGRESSGKKSDADRHKQADCHDSSGHHDDGHYHDHHHHHGDSIKWLQDAVPGEPGLDYPTLSRVNSSNFNCRSQKWPGYYADVDARCQVFHICQADGRQDSFLCPNGTIFSQISRVCVWWNSFDCEDAPKYYELNAKLYEASRGRSASEEAGRRQSELRPLDGTRFMSNGGAASDADESSSLDNLIRDMMRKRGPNVNQAGTDLTSSGRRSAAAPDGLSMMQDVDLGLMSGNRSASRDGSRSNGEIGPDDEASIQRKTNEEDASAFSRLRKANAEPRRKRRASVRQAPPKLKSRRVSRNSRRRKLRHGIKPKRRA